VKHGVALHRVPQLRDSGHTGAIVVKRLYLADWSDFMDSVDVTRNGSGMVVDTCLRLARYSERAMTPKLLVVDDDETNCRLIAATFVAEGLDVIVAHDGPSGLEQAVIHRPDVVILDLRLPGLDGLQVLECLKSAHPAVPVVMLTAERDVKSAVRATQLGAFNYLTKPIDDDEIVVAVRRALETRALRLEVEELRRHSGKGDTLAAQMGTSRQVEQVVEQVETVAASNFTVLVLGETGTGKELVAQAIHRQSERRRKPFVALDCGAIPEQLLESELFGHERGAFTGADQRKQGRFQLAEGGTCLLDEVGNLQPSLQVKLLRVLESKQLHPVGADRASPMDIRFVAATNHDLQQRVSEGQFRSDLYFRLAQYTIALPPLRDRTDDITYLAQRFIEEASVELRRPIQNIVPAALDLLVQHSWPGNVRELRNVVRRAVLETKEFVIRPDVVRAVLGAPATASSAGASPIAFVRTADQSLKAIAEQAARAAERQAICEALRATGGNKSQAASVLKTGYKTLHTKMRDLGIESRDFS
jgi:DNA-binding NtrC family response regulator